MLKYFAPAVQNYASGWDNPPMTELRFGLSKVLVRRSDVSINANRLLEKNLDVIKLIVSCLFRAQLTQAELQGTLEAYNG